jgi:hypothetical protein
MLQQLSIDWSGISLHPENNKESEEILEANKDHLNTQCKMVKSILESGYRLTVRSAMINYGIGDLRRRVKDLRDYHGMDIKSRLIEGRFKEYFL